MLTTKKMLVPALLIGSVLVWTLSWQTSANAQMDSGIGRNLAVVVQGTATGEFRMIDGVEMDCFDVDLVDAVTGRIVGRGTDCLDLNSIVPDPSGGTGFSISNTTFFHLPGGTIKSRNRTTIQPVLEGSPGITHLTATSRRPRIFLTEQGDTKALRARFALTERSTCRAWATTLFRSIAYSGST